MHLQSFGERGELMDVQAVSEQWRKNAVYCVAPQGVQAILHLLVMGGKLNTRSVEDAQVCFAKIAEVLEAVWPTSTPRSIDVVPYGKARIHVPKDAGR